MILGTFSTLRQQQDGSLDKNCILHANRPRIILLFSYQNSGDTAYDYAYDDNRNIASITRGSSAVAYQYNGANELVRENNRSTQPHDYL